uniref:IPT/TIG domain-containing protein n=1 Tax=Triticum aestivum TaxID=4565 RepID=A0A3B6DCI1_WHEAT
MLQDPSHVWHDCMIKPRHGQKEGGKQSFSRSKEAEDSPACSNSFASQSQVASQTMDAESPYSGQISEYEDAETDNSRASSRYHPFVEMQQPVDGVMMDNRLGAPAPSTSVNNLGYQDENQARTANISNNFVTHHGIASVFNDVGAGLRSGSKTALDSVHFGEPFPEYPTGFTEPTLYSSVTTMGSNNLDDNSRLETLMTEALYTNNLTQKETDALSAAGMTSSQVHNDSYTDGSMGYPLLKQSSLDLFKIEPNGLKKFDSFSKWMSDELAADLDIKSTSDAFWSSTETVNVADGSSMSIPMNEQLDAYVVSPSLSQDQLFSIIDVSPSWAYTGSQNKVLITGTFLTNKEHVENCKWSCMFGDVEVPVEVLADGSLRCYTPVHQSGRVPFYVTCSNRVACSEVREFEFHDSETQHMEAADPHITGINEMHLHIRLEKLLSLGPDDYEKYVMSGGNEKSELISTIGSLMLDDKFTNLSAPSDEEFSAAQDKNLEKSVKDKLYYWLIHKIHDDGKGPNVLGKEGQGVIHLVAALGYDWAIRPIIAAGVHVNFRDVRGWTALHWAASCGRERTVGALITNGAAAGALTDPTPHFLSGRTPADLASDNGHKGIAGFLAESALTSHLSALTLKEAKGCNVEEICGSAEADGFAEPSSAQLSRQDSQAESLKDSLSAVRKSTLAASKIFQAFRVESFHRKKVVEYGDDDCGLSDERTLSLVSLKNTKSGQNDMPHSAAVRIQNKFRGWKGRKEFMIIRQKIIKIQAHIRGHQVRRNYKKVIWSVGIVEKVILRWRRKGRGLRGFQPDKQLEGPSSQIQPAEGGSAEAEDEYDFLKDGRKQAEGRLQRSLARVKSMTQYPEAREQYSRLQACVTELQESKAIQDKMLSDAAGGDGGDFMVDLEDLCADELLDTPMSTIL